MCLYECLSRYVCISDFRSYQKEKNYIIQINRTSAARHREKTGDECSVGCGEGSVGLRAVVGRHGYRFWQHCSLLPFCPSVVGGTLMSTTLFPGDSS